MPLIRVYLITFRRASLLPRAIRSLQDQTVTDWVCDVQNGDPDDDGPGRLIDSLGDARFRLVTPPRRIGPVEAFNLAHTPAPEPFQTLLEDDNWWEPGFLAEMLAALTDHPEAELAWSNMRIWKEQADGGWEDTDRLVWNLAPDSPPRLFAWPHLIQFADMIYSNGSTLLRSRSASGLSMPDSVPRDMLEQVRERLMSFAILLVPAPLANFSVTRQTMRSTDRGGWGESQALLGASFLAHVPMTDAARSHLWAAQRAQRPRSTTHLIFAGLIQRDWTFLRHADAGDWLAFLRGWIRRPWTMGRILRAPRRHSETWMWLQRITQRRTDLARRAGFLVLGADSLVNKQAPGRFGLPS